jgi:hypothetical protein
MQSIILKWVTINKLLTKMPNNYQMYEVLANIQGCEKI